MAATAHAEIRVYASFPRVVRASLNLNARNWHWVHCLTLPLATLGQLQFSPRPYKWIRYAVGIVVGAEGDLSSSRDLLNIVNYNAALPTQSASLYYHASNDERRRMFPIDPDIERTNVTSSIAVARWEQFRNEVPTRDGNNCVLTAMEKRHCEARNELEATLKDAKEEAGAAEQRYVQEKVKTWNRQVTS